MATASTYDDHFIRFLMRQADLPAEAAAIIRKLCQAVRSHHSCLPLDDVNPSLIDSLLATPIACKADAGENRPSEQAPLVIAGNRLYLHRHHLAERHVAGLLIERNQAMPIDAKIDEKNGENVNAKSHAKMVSDYVREQFPASGKPDFQKLAVFQAVNRQLTIITGGPGTGKTWVVHKVIDLLKLANPDLRVRLAAPTGKAAMRLGDSFKQSLNRSNASQGNDEKIHDHAVPGDDSKQSRMIGVNPGKPESPHKGTRQSDGLTQSPNKNHAGLVNDDAVPEVLTLHRLLGIRPDGRQARHDANNPIVADVLVVDEASMIDLDMMARVLAALPKHARLILLGDPHQLPSVDTGNVLADICATDPEYSQDFCDLAREVMELQPTAKPGKLVNALCRLESSRRFTADSSIGQLAAAIKAGSARAQDSADGAVQFQDLLDLKQENVGSLLGHWQDYLDLLQQGPSKTGNSGDEASFNARALDLLQSFDTCRILCSHRNGFPGVNVLNESLLHELEHLGLKKPGEAFFHGRPIMITRNDYNLRLFNGDTGLCVKMPDGSHRIAFPDSQAGLRLCRPSRLPSYETCYAMTVHKAQGSEFDQVIFMLSNAESEELDELVTRELIYTAITRARQAVTIHCTPASWDAALAKTATRKSGMAEHLAA